MTLEIGREEECLQVSECEEEMDSCRGLTWMMIALGSMTEDGKGRNGGGRWALGEQELTGGRVRTRTEAGQCKFWRDLY